MLTHVQGKQPVIVVCPRKAYCTGIVRKMPGTCSQPLRILHRLNWQYTVAVDDSAIEDRVFRLARLHNAGLGESALYFVHANGVATITTH